MGASAVVAVGATVLSAIAVGALVFVFEPPGVTPWLALGLPLLVASGGTVLVALALPQDGTVAERGRPLGDLLLVGAFSAAALVALGGLTSANGYWALCSAISGYTTDPSQVARLAAEGLAAQGWARTRLPLFLLPLLLVPLAAAVPALSALAGGFKRSVLASLLVLVGLGSLFVVRAGATEEALGQLTAWSDGLLPEDVTPATVSTGERLMSLRGTGVFVGRDKLYQAEHFGSPPDPIGARADLASPRCGETMRGVRMVASSRRDSRFAVGADESLTVREMTCILVGLQHESAATHPSRAWRFPYGIMAGMRRPGASIEVRWVTYQGQPGLPAPYSSLVNPYGHVQVLLAAPSIDARGANGTAEARGANGTGEPSAIAVSLEEDRWRLDVGGKSQELTGDLASRLQQLRVPERAGADAWVTVTAPANAPAREVLAIAGAPGVVGVRLAPHGYGKGRVPPTSR